jgi:hypothetical protein
MPYLERPAAVAEVLCQRLYDGDLPPSDFTQSPAAPDLCVKWLGDRGLPFLVSVELEQDAFAPIPAALPFPVERVGLVDERTALYRRTDV